jgi:hypothetical protein
VVVSADSDFAMLLASQSASEPSFILFREPELTLAEQYFELLLAALRVLEPELAIGCVAVFRCGRPRVPRLPLAD